jgi:hypothetical protein
MVGLRWKLAGFMTVGAVSLFASRVEAETLTWGAVSDLPNGVLGVGDLTLGSSASRLFVNPGNEGFDVEVRFFGSQTDGSSSNFNGGFTASQPELGGGSYIWFQSNPSNGQHFAWIELYFFETGTSNPIDVLGLKFRIEDVERGSSNTASDSSPSGLREYLIGPKMTSNGVTQLLDFNDTAIFDLPTGDHGKQVGSKTITFNGVPETVSRAVPGWSSAGGTQAGKYVEVDLSTTPVSYFRIGQSRLHSSSGSVLIGSLGDIVLAPQAQALPTPNAALGGLTILGGMIGYRVLRRKIGSGKACDSRA